MFFSKVSRIDDALRLCALCDVACTNLRSAWLNEKQFPEGAAPRLPTLCQLLITRCLFLLNGLADLDVQEEGKVLPDMRGVDILGRIVRSQLQFLTIFLDLEGVYAGSNISVAISHTLALAIEQGLFRCISRLIKLSASLEDTTLQSDTNQLSMNLLKKSLGAKHVHWQILDLLTVKDASAGILNEVREPYWEALMEATRKSSAADMQKHLSQYRREAGANVVMLNNFLVLSRKQANQSLYLDPLLRLMDGLLTASLEGLNLEPGAIEDGDGDVFMKSDLASEEVGRIVSILTENIDMWNHLSKSILPSRADEEMSDEKLNGTTALVSLFSKLITYCGHAQPLVLLLTSLAFKVEFLEKLWFYSQHLDLTSISEVDQDNTRKAVIVICTVHVLRLQIINDKEYYQQNLLMDISELNHMVVFLRTYLWRLIEVENITMESIEGDSLYWNNKIVFHKAVDHLCKLHEQNGRYHLIDERSFHLQKFPGDEALFKELESDGRARLVCTYCPYFIAFHDRAKIFRYYLEKDRAHYYSNLPSGARMNPFLSAKTVTIRRKYILEDGYAKLDELGQALKCIVRIQFINELGEEEAGVDGGGLFKDFLENLITTAFDTQYGFFRSNPENKLYPNPSSSSVSHEHLNFFRFFGRMIGKAIYEGILVDVPFAEFFLRKIRGKKNGFDDLQYLDKELHNNLCFLRGYEGKIEDLGLYFAVEQNNFGQVVEENLVPNGKDVRVTNANVIKYIHLMANFKLNLQLKSQVVAFMQGLQDLIDVEWIALFNDAELQELISGSAKGLDLEDMKKYMHYSGGYSESHPAIEMFWDILSGFSIQEQAGLLKFVTACSRPPLLGFKYLEPKLCIQKTAESEEDYLSRLPTAATCMNLLKLPPYGTKKEMAEKLLYAIQQGAGFYLS